MTKQHINIGQSANDKAGDPLRTAFSKVNENFDELYNHVSAGVVAGNTAPTDPGEGDLWWDSESGRIYVYYGSTWVDASPVDGAGISSTNELVNGDSLFNMSSDGTLTLTHPAEPNYHPLSTTLTIQKAAGNYHTISGAYGLSLQATPVPSGYGLNTNTNFVDIFHDGISVNVNDNTWTFGTDGKLTFPDALSIKDSIIGKNSTNTITEEDPAGTTTETTVIESQIEIEASGIVIAKRIIQTFDDGVVTVVDEQGSVLTLNNSVASIKRYADPAGPNNIAYSQFTTDSGAKIETVQEDVGGIAHGRVNATLGSVQVSAKSEIGDQKYWLFDNDGSLTLPNNSTISPVEQVGYTYGPYATDIYGGTLGAGVVGITYINVGVSTHATLFNDPVAPASTITGTIAANGDFEPGTPTTGTFTRFTLIIIDGQRYGSLGYRDDANPSAGLRIGQPGDTYEGGTIPAGIRIDGWRGRQTVTPKTTTYIKWADGSSTQVTGSRVRFPNESYAGIVTADDVSAKSFPATIYTANYSAAKTAIRVNGKQWGFGTDGSLTVPQPTSTPFTLTFAATNYVATGEKPTLTLTGDPWELHGQYVYASDGRSSLMLDDPFPILTNPGYDTSDSFTFGADVHGIVGYTLTITLDNVVEAGPAGWTANVIASAAPAYPSTILTSGAIKLTTNNNSNWIFGTDGKITFPGANGFQATFGSVEPIGDVLHSINDLVLKSDHGVTIVSGEGIDALETSYNDQLTDLTSLLSAELYGTSFLPASHDSIIALAAAKAVNPLISDQIITVAQAVSDAWDAWQEALSLSAVTIGVGNLGWYFNSDGNLTFPNGDLTIGRDPYGDPAILAAPGKNIGLVSSGVGDGYDIGSSLIWVDSITEPTKIAGVTANNPLYVGAGDVGIVTGDYLYTGNTNVWNFGTDGALTFPNGALKIAGNTISNLTGVGTSLVAGSQLEVSPTKTVITYGTTNYLEDPSIPSLISQYLSETSANGILNALQVTTMLDATSGLTSEHLTELDQTSFKIGLRVTNILDGSPPLTSFSGWTFGTVDTLQAITFPQGTVIRETPTEHGLYRTKYSGNFVLDPTWFAANAGNIVNGDSFPEGVLQNYDEVETAFSFQYFGYFVPPTSANYTFRAHADETFIFWIGNKALSGYTYVNKDMYGNYNGTFPEQQVQSFTIALTAGQFYPIRIQWANGSGWGQLDVFTWGNDAGQAATADFTGRVFRENTGTAKIAVNDNRSIILSTDNATDNNWTFAPNGALSFPGSLTVEPNNNSPIFRTNNDFNIITDGTGYTWTFDSSGSLTFPNASTFNGVDFVAKENDELNLTILDSSAYIGVKQSNNLNEPAAYMDVYFGKKSRIRTTSLDNQTEYDWYFNPDGSLALPRGSYINESTTAAGSAKSLDLEIGYNRVSGDSRLNVINENHNGYNNVADNILVVSGFNPITANIDSTWVAVYDNSIYPINSVTVSDGNANLWWINIGPSDLVIPAEALVDLWELHTPNTWAFGTDGTLTLPSRGKVGGGYTQGLTREIYSGYPYFSTGNFVDTTTWFNDGRTPTNTSVVNPATFFWDGLYDAEDPQSGPPPNTSWKLTGYFIPPVSGEYNLIAACNDHGWVSINGVNSTSENQAATLTLTENIPYPLTVYFTNTNTNGTLNLQWKNNSTQGSYTGDFAGLLFTDMSVEISASNGSNWTFGGEGTLTLPEGSTITDNRSFTNFTAGTDYTTASWGGDNVALTGASVSLQNELSLLEHGDFISLTTVRTGTITATVYNVYTGGSGGSLTVVAPVAGAGDSITNITLLDRTASGIELTTHSNTWTFGTDGELSLPAGGDVINSTGVSQLANRVEGSWTVTTGTNTYSFTVPMDGTYTMWVKGNIPNGIITWNATLSITNNNVPAIGTQYAWNYTGGGSPILLTAIPDQIRGSAGTISTDATYVGTTSNRFDFGISNSSGSSQTIYYGYIKI